MSEGKRLRATIVDMQPITPAVGGGRQRLLGLYHALGKDIEATYVGSYDWPGEPPRDQQLTPGLREIAIPLSDAHHRAASEWRESMDGRVVIDCMFPEQVRLSPHYLAAARKAIAGADVVVFSHPWAYPALKQDLEAGQLLVYDSQNVESVLRADILAGSERSRQVIELVVATEYELCRKADLVLACSQEDRMLFHRLFDISPDKIRVVPNGIFAHEEIPASPEEKLALKDELGVRARPLVAFLGSDYGPNNEAASIIAGEICPQHPEVQFVLMGGCCHALESTVLPPNLLALGVVEEAAKNRWLRAADVALNPLRRGSGTSIKMFDYLARGLPTLATPCGARGIVSASSSEAYRVVPVSRVPAALGTMLQDAQSREHMASAGRKLVLDFYAWERISPNVGRLIAKHHREKQRGRTFFSVVIPSYERPQHLDRLMTCLEAQEEKDFEVIIIDQSEKQWSGKDREWPFSLTYVWTTVRGAVKARNTGGYFASGEVIAFTDDDCEPRAQWLKNARDWFARAAVAGVEGVIKSSNLDDPDWRPVSNVGFEGIGFMTANLLVRNRHFQQLDGFDLGFDNPHFREDTDFGWRLQELGDVPFADDVEVYHPPHKREIARESHEARGRFFEKDALLFKKHPEKYQKLFLAESHWRNTPRFWDNFHRGLKIYDVEPPTWLSDFE